METVIIQKRMCAEISGETHYLSIAKHTLNLFKQNL